MEKRGISPLIATVLIIGFVIILAALVIQWGTGLFEGIKQESGEEAQKALACSKINLKMGSVETDFFNSKFEIGVESLAEQKISGFVVRLTGENGADVEEVDDELNLGELKKLNSKFNIVKTGLVNKIEVFPKVEIENKKLACERALSKENVINYDPDRNEIEKIWRIWDDDNLQQFNFLGGNNCCLDQIEKYSGIYSWKKSLGRTIWDKIIPSLNLEEADYIILSPKRNGQCFTLVEFQSDKLHSIGYALYGGRNGAFYKTPNLGLYDDLNWYLISIDLKNPTIGSPPTGELKQFIIETIKCQSSWFDTIYFYSVKK